MSYFCFRGIIVLIQRSFFFSSSTASFNYHHLMQNNERTLNYFFSFPVTFHAFRYWCDTVRNRALWTCVVWWYCATITRFHFFQPPRFCLYLFTGHLDSNSCVFNGMCVMVVTLATRRAMISKLHMLYHKTTELTFRYMSVI